MSKTFEISGHKYRQEMLPGLACYRLYTQVVKSIRETAATSKSPEIPTNATDDQVAQVLQAATENFLVDIVSDLPVDLVDEMCQALGKYTFIVKDNQELQMTPAIFDAHFMGRPSDVMPWLIHGMQNNQMIAFLEDKSIDQSNP